MTLEANLDNLKSINGYKASAIMSFTGEVLVFDQIDENVNIAATGAIFNDIFRSAHEATGKVGLECCNQLEIATPKGLVIMACSGVDAKVHFHLITVLGAEGNQALVKMTHNKILGPIMEELA